MKWGNGGQERIKNAPKIFTWSSEEMAMAFMEIRNNIKRDRSLMENNEFCFRYVKFEVLETKLFSNQTEIWV